MNKTTCPQKELIAVGNIPPPYTGSRTSFQLWVDICTEEYNITVIPFYKRYRIFGFMTFPIRLAYACKKNQPTIYYHHSGSKFGTLRNFVVSQIAKLYNCKLVAHIHSGNLYSPEGKFYWLENSYNKSVSQYILLSPKLNYNSHILEKSVIVPNFVPDTVSAKKAALTKSNEQPLNTKKIVTFFSNLMKEKGIFEFLQAAELLLQNQENEIIFFCAGAIMPPNEAISKIIYQLEQTYPGGFKYLGSVTGQEKENLLSMTDVMVLMSAYQNEAQPICLIEALQYGISIICTDYRTLPELCSYGKGGVICKNELESISRAIQNLCVNEVQRKQIAQHNRNKFLTEYTLNYENKRKIIQAILIKD